MRNRLGTVVVATVCLSWGGACGDGESRFRAGDCGSIAALSSSDPLVLARVFSGVAVEGAVALRQPPGDGSRWYLLAQAGVVYTFANDADATPSVALDLTDAMATASEAGLLGIAFHPNYADNGHVYLSYTTPGGGAFLSRIARYTTADGGLTFDRGTEQIILDVEQPYTNHNGGDIHFGPDGHLYFGLGDGGSREDPDGHGQNTDTMLGAMLRLDVDSAEPYAIPPDNPFAGGGGAAEIYAWGLRNPWRFSFDRATGELWTGDVGQYDWEEVDRIRLGGNYGWSLKEGSHCFAQDPCDVPGLIDPVAEYANPDDASVVGGYVYRGGAIPELEGTYLYTDFYTGRIWGVVEGSEPITLASGTGITASAFGEGADGELYVLDYAGAIYRLDPNPREDGPTSLPVRLSETGCVDPSTPSQPGPGMLPYDLNVPFWSDGAEKDRWLWIPEGEQVQVGADGDWELPPGSVAVKHFRRDGRDLETRFLVRHEDGRWAGYSYAWREDGSDAELLAGGTTRDVGDGSWVYPSRSDCAACHTSAAGGSLGLETGQLDRDDQLEQWQSRGWLADPGDHDPLPSTDGDASLDERARAYLHANCAQCHRPGGRSNTPANFVYGTPLADMGICEVPPTAGDLGVDDARILAPGDPERSILSRRMHATGRDRMPPIGSLLHDQAGLELIDAWIESQTGCAGEEAGSRSRRRSADTRGAHRTRRSDPGATER